MRSCPSSAPDRDPDRPVYVISVAASIVSAHPRTLRIYEDEGLLCPARTPTNIRLYSENDIRRITWIRHLTRERGVNLAGIRSSSSSKSGSAPASSKRSTPKAPRRRGGRRPSASAPAGSATAGPRPRPRHRRAPASHPRPRRAETPSRRRHLMAKRPTTPVERARPTTDHAVLASCPSSPSARPSSSRR